MIMDGSLDLNPLALKIAFKQTEDEFPNIL
jgi:hypothetical protein